MRRWSIIVIVVSALAGCGVDDDDDVAETKTLLSMDQVPAVVLTEAKKAYPDLEFFGAAKDKFKGQDSIELRGKTKSGQIKEVEMTPEGKVLGLD
jgi:hypothetical protein